jgi:hypothetical protein
MLIVTLIFAGSVIMMNVVSVSGVVLNLLNDWSMSNKEKTIVQFTKRYQCQKTLFFVMALNRNKLEPFQWQVFSA